MLFLSPGLHLLSGTEPDSNVRIRARGERGGIYLSSDVLHWTASSSFANSSGTFAAGASSANGVRVGVPAHNRRGEGAAVGKGERRGAAGEEYEASFRIDEDTLETRGLTTVKLGAGRSFDLTVVGWPEGGMADEPSGGAVRGDVESLNASAGVVNVQVNTLVCTYENVSGSRERGLFKIVLHEARWRIKYNVVKNCLAVRWVTRHA